MKMKPFVYAGPSWAKRSFDDPDKNIEISNLAKEWELPYFNCAEEGSNNLQQVQYVKNTLTDLPIIWVMCEPLVELTISDDTLSRSNLYRVHRKKALIKKYLNTPDHLSVRQIINFEQLSAMNALNRPIGLIGGHSDIQDSDITFFKNITIIDHSWQNFLAKLAGIDYNQYNFGFEISHRILHGNHDIAPSDKLVNDIYQGLEFWKLLEKKNLFYEVHPNRVATEEYAKYLKDKVIEFIEKNS
jgi:hypothetical protein